MAWRRTPAPYDRGLLAEAPVLEHGVPTSYDVGLLNAGVQVQAPAHAQVPSPPRTSNIDSAKEANEAGFSPPPMHQGPVVPFWRRRVGMIVIGVIVGVILIIALVGGSLGAAAAATVNRDHRQSQNESSVLRSSTAASVSSSTSSSSSSQSSVASTSTSSTTTSATIIPTIASPLPPAPITARSLPTARL